MICQAKKAMVEKALLLLNESQYVVIKLYFWEEKKEAEIGAMINVSESRVCQIKAKALADMRMFFYE